MNNWKAWLKGLAAAAITGAAGGATDMVSHSGTVNKATGISAGVMGLLGGLLYLMKSPLKDEAPVEVPPTASSTTPSGPA